MENSNKTPRSTVPWWALLAVLMVGPFGLLPVALSRQTERSVRLAVSLPIFFAAVPLLVLLVVIVLRR